MSFFIVSSMTPSTFTTILRDIGFKKHVQNNSPTYWDNPRYDSIKQSNEARCYITRPIFKSLLRGGEPSMAPKDDIWLWSMVRADDVPMNDLVREHILYKRIIVYDIKYNLYYKLGDSKKYKV